MSLLRKYDHLIQWLENRATMFGESRKYLQIEWQVAQQLRFIKDMLTDDQLEELHKFINRGVR